MILTRSLFMRVAIGAIALPILEPTGGYAQPPVQRPQQQRLQRRPAMPTIHVGEPIQSRLAAESEEAHEDYLLRLQENDSVEILMQSPAAPPSGQASTGTTAAPQGFDTYLELRRAGSDTPLATNDDRGDGTYNSRLIFTAPAAADYIIRARPLSSVAADADPSYALEVRALPRPPAPEPITGTVAGDLGQNSPVIDIGGGEPAAYRAYWFTGAAGERVRIAMTSNGSDPGVQLIGPDGAVVAAELADEQGAAQLVAVLPQSGRYLVQALAGRAQPAHYGLELTRAMPGPIEPPMPIATSAPVDGAFTLASNSNLGRGGRASGSPFFYKLYALPVQVGQPITVTVEATGFDPILEAGTLSVLGFVQVFSDDDSGPGNAARLVIQPFDSGTVYLRVRSPSLSVGTFRLRAVPGELPPEP